VRDVAGKVAAVLAADGRRLSRDRTALFFILILPAFIILIVGVGIGGATTKLAVGVLDRDGGSLSTELRAALEHSPRLRVETFRSESRLRTAVRHSEIDGGVVIPANYDAGLRAGSPSGVEFVVNPAAQTSVATRGLVAAAVDVQSSAVGGAQFAHTTAATSFDAGFREARALAAAGGGVAVRVSTGSGRGPLPFGFSYTAPSNLVLFVFITSLAAGGAIVFARQLGVTRRMLATPTSPSVVLLGQASSRFATALVQGLFILVLGRVIFGVNWGDLVAAAILIVAFSLVATGAALVIGTSSRTAEQAGAIAAPIGIALGMLGGCMWPLVIAPPVMRAIGHATPHAWAMDGFIELIARGGHTASIVPYVVALSVFAVVLLGVGTWRLRRSIFG
jgi:ABC-2 type transport system permease protein